MLSVCVKCVLCVCREHVERKLVLPDSFDAREQCVCVKCVLSVCVKCVC